MEKVLQRKICVNCQNSFPIFEKDQGFYNLLDVPKPTHCYFCRIQRRLSYRNERFLYHRKCDLTGKSIISSFSEDKPFPVYDLDAWWSDNLDALSYGRDFDFNRAFFKQFFELRNSVPRLALQQQKPMWNSDYCNCASQNKNCYLVFSTNRCEDCYYGSWVNDCVDCIDVKNVSGCELCYDCVNCYNCYNLKYSQDCSNSKNSYFLRDCTSCMDCFACSNLHNKQYYIFNDRKTKGEYENFMKNVNLGSYKIIQEGKAKAQKILNDLIVKEYHGTNNENSLGDYIYHTKNCFYCFDCEDCEDVRYANCVEKEKTSMDRSHWGVNCERLYECQACGYDLFNLRFCNLCWSGCNDLLYCDMCFSSKNCFGCVGLKKKEYCILNKQYSRKEYEDLLPRILSHLKQTSQFGEFFPISQSCFAYNESLAMEQIPLTKDEVLSKGWQWKDKDPKEYKPQNYKIPDDIKNVPENILNEVLECESCGKNYKIVQPEFNFYKEQNIPIPHKCADCRHQDRMAVKNKYLIFENFCKKCQKEIKTTYKSGRSEKIYCEKCYLEAVF